MNCYKYNSVEEMFIAVFSKARHCKNRKLSKSQIKRNKEIQKAIYEYISMIDAANEETKESALQFDF